MSRFSKSDLDQFKKQEISVSEVEYQIESINRGFPFLDIIAPCVPGKGIRMVSKEMQSQYILKYKSSSLQVSRFVPASGAATRMFKDLYEAAVLIEKGGRPESSSPASLFLSSLDRFPFIDDLKQLPSFNSGDYLSVIRLLLLDHGLGYGSKPKGLLKFHNYSGGSRTAFEEQLVESVKYAVNNDGVAKLMLTVSAEHLESFNNLYLKLKEKIIKERGTNLIVDFTLQKKSTDTIAVDLEGNPFRNEDGSILFRPGGHGALIGNLQEINSDIIFIKNIDNVTREELLDDTTIWKQTLAGLLINFRERCFGYLNKLDGEFNSELNVEIIEYLKEEFCIEIPDLPEELTRDYLYAKLNRPIRVCGMVKNEGEPGGGPFVVRDADGSTSLQILESAQLDTSHPDFKRWSMEATHFNPVDIVCSIIDYQGNKYNLNKFIDVETGFVSIKSLKGKSLKALELPGLWNGAMSNWNTIFVEVPVSTFNPVKTVNDLLRPQHAGDRV